MDLFSWAEQADVDTGTETQAPISPAEPVQLVPPPRRKRRVPQRQVAFDAWTTVPLEQQPAQLRDRVTTAADALAMLETLAGLTDSQRAAIRTAMAMATSPGILLLDEPTCGLAPAVVEEVFAALSAVAAANVSMPVVVVEQNVVPVLAFAPRAVVVRQGRIAYDGPSVPLRDPAALLEYY